MSILNQFSSEIEIYSIDEAFFKLDNIKDKDLREYALKIKIIIEKDCVYLVPENRKYKTIKITKKNELIVWGIVTYVIKQV